MSDQEYVIELEDDTEGHRFVRGIVEPEEGDWLEERLRESGKANFRVALSDDDDTEGHALRGGTTVRVSLADDDDTEGHAIAIHFPTRSEADAFRRRLMVTGVLVGTVALGAAGGVGLSALQSDGDAGTGAAAQSQAYANYQEAAANEGERQGAADAQRQAYANYQEAAANEGERQGGAAAATQTGPMDAHEAPAFQQSSASTVDADRDIGIMDASGAAAATQTGPMDVHEAPAFQQSAQTGPMDAHEAPAFQSGSGTDTDEGSEPSNIGGPSPR